MLAGAAVLSFVGGVDFDQFREALRDASWGWIAAGAIVAQLPRLTQAVATRAAIPAQVPFGPVYTLQLATSYMNLALPTSLATMGIAVRFFQRQGVPPAAAVTSSTVNSVVNNAVQGVMLVALLAFSSVTLNLDIGAPSASGATHILFVLLAIAVIAAVVLGHPGKARAWLQQHWNRWWPEVRGTISSLRESHKLGPLIPGNVATEILFATALGLFTRALGFPLSIADLLVINLSTSLCVADPRARGMESSRGSGRRAVVRRDGTVGGVCGGAALPHRDVLPPAGVGLVRDELAAPESVSVAVCRMIRRPRGVDIADPSSPYRFLTPSHLAAQTPDLQRVRQFAFVQLTPQGGARMRNSRFVVALAAVACAAALPAAAAAHKGHPFHHGHPGKGKDGNATVVRLAPAADRRPRASSCSQRTGALSVSARLG